MSGKFSIYLLPAYLNSFFAGPTFRMWHGNRVSREAAICQECVAGSRSPCWFVFIVDLCTLKCKRGGHVCERLSFRVMTPVSALWVTPSVIR